MQAYQGSLRLQEGLAQNRIRFSQRLNEMSDELLGLAREGEKLRKLVSRLRFESKTPQADRTRSTRRTACGIRVYSRRARWSWTR